MVVLIQCPAQNNCKVIPRMHSLKGFYSTYIGVNQPCHNNPSTKRFVVADDCKVSLIMKQEYLKSSDTTVISWWELSRDKKYASCYCEHFTCFSQKVDGGVNTLS